MIDSLLSKQLNIVFSDQPSIISAYIIGSCATGTEREDSDFDVAVIVDNSRKTSIDSIYSSLATVSFPKDLDLSVVDKKSSPLFLFQIISKGKIVYERTPNNRADFEAFVMHNYYDTQHIRNMYHQQLKEKYTGAQYVN